jgi:hypothetical protein
MTKFLTPIKRIRFVAVTITLAAAVALAASIWHSAAFQQDAKAKMKQQFYARVRDGVGSEVELAKRNSAHGQIRAAVNSVTNFIDKRSGVRLSEATKNRLAAMEERVQNGAARRLTASELGGALNAILLERLSKLSDQEIAHVDDALRGFNAPEMPKNFDRDFHLPGGVVFIGTPPEKTQERLRAVRDQLSTPAGAVFTGMARKFVVERVEERARYLSGAIPEQFGSLWDTTYDKEIGEPSGGVSPLQAVFIAYSVVSDDYMTDSATHLAQYMAGREKSLTELTGKPYPAPDGHRAYGVNGYLFSSPLDIVFDEQTVNRLLDRIEERSAR